MAMWLMDELLGRVARVICSVVGGILLFTASAASWALTRSDVLVSDVSANSFTLSWQVDQPAQPNVEVFADINGIEALTDSVITYHSTYSGDAAMAEDVRQSGIMLVRISGLKADTPYFYRLGHTLDASSATEVLPVSGILPSVRTEKHALPYSAESVAIDVFRNDQSDPANGSLLVIDIANAKWPLTAWVGDGYPDATGMVNLTNLYDRNASQRLTVTGGEALTVYAYGGAIGQAMLSDVTMNNEGQGDTYFVNDQGLVLTQDPFIDSDGDGLPDAYETANALNPNDSSDANLDMDGDGLTNFEEHVNGTDPQNPDSDGDQVSDGDEVNTHGTLPLQQDTDQDGRSDFDELLSDIKTDPLNADSDNDGVNDFDEVENDSDPNDSLDLPFLDEDGDGIADAEDNCPNISNSTQDDNDLDSIGNVCDSDDDNDGIEDYLDNAPLIPNPDQKDTDADNIGDIADNCPDNFNEHQLDTDGDGQGNACDQDSDNDGINDWLPLAESSTKPFLFSQLLSVTSINVTGFTNDAAIRFGKRHHDSDVTTWIADYFTATQSLVERSIDPDFVNLSGYLVMVVDISGCNCISFNDDSFFTLSTDVGNITIRMPPDEDDPALKFVLRISDDGSIYTRTVITDGTVSLGELLQTTQMHQPDDNCRTTFNPSQRDHNGNGIGDHCDLSPEDIDGDGVLNEVDNCLVVHNFEQSDEDNDGLGDECDLDSDNDGLTDEQEAVLKTNPESEDSDNDGIEDSEEDFDFDGYSNAEEFAQETDPLMPTILLRPGRNEIHLPSHVASLSASQLLNNLGGPDVVDSIEYHNQLTQDFVKLGYVNNELAGNDFFIASDMGYIITATNEVVYELPQSIACKSLSLKSGFNFIGFRCLPQQETAFGLLNKLDASVSASLEYYDSKVKEYKKAEYNNGTLDGVDFLLSNTLGYRIRIDRDYTLSTNNLTPADWTLSDISSGFVTVKNTIILTGQVDDPNAQVFINDVLAETDKEGGSAVFSSQSIDLAEGHNSIILTIRYSNNVVITEDIIIERIDFPRISFELPEGPWRTRNFHLIGQIEGEVDTLTVDGNLVSIEPFAYPEDSYLRHASRFSLFNYLDEGDNQLTTIVESDGQTKEFNINVEYQPFKIKGKAGATIIQEVPLFTEELFKITDKQVEYAIPKIELVDGGSEIPLGLIFNHAELFDGLSQDLSQESFILPEDIKLGVYHFSTNANRFKGLLLDENSSNYELTVMPASGAPLIIVTGQETGSQFTEENQTIEGYLVEGDSPLVSLTINDTNVPVNSGTFSFDVQLQQGKNVFSVIASNAEGRYETTLHYFLASECVTNLRFFTRDDSLLDLNSPFVDRDGDNYSNQQEKLAGTDDHDACDHPNTFDQLSFSERYHIHFDTSFDIKSPPVIESPSGDIFIRFSDDTLQKYIGDSVARWSMDGALSSELLLASKKRLYIGYDEGVYSIDTDTGEALADFKTSSKVIGSPTVDAEENIYFGDTSGILYSYSDSNNQSPLWAFSTNASIISSPVINYFGDVFVGNADGKLFSISASGVENWNLQLIGSISLSPAISENGDLIVSTDAGNLYRISKSGTILWEHNFSGQSFDSSPTISKDGIIVFVSNDNKYHYLRALNSSGQQLWQVRNIQKRVLFRHGRGEWVERSHALVVDDKVLTLSRGSLNVHSLEDGSFLARWSDRLASSRNYESLLLPPSIGRDGSIYIVSPHVQRGLAPRRGADLYRLAFAASNAHQEQRSWFHTARNISRVNNQCAYNDQLLSVNSDSDNDGIYDCYEHASGLLSNDPKDALDDADNDGVSNLDEFLKGTDLYHNDTDRDGVSDYDELNIYQTDATDFGDQDSDSLSDDLESILGLSPLISNFNRDSDADGFSDIQEVLSQTSPNNVLEKPIAGNILFEHKQTLSSSDYKVKRLAIDSKNNYYVDFHSYKYSNIFGSYSGFSKLSPIGQGLYYLNLSGSPSVISDALIYIGGKFISDAGAVINSAIDSDEYPKANGVEFVSSAIGHDSIYKSQELGGGYYLSSFNYSGEAVWRKYIGDSNANNSTDTAPIIDAWGNIYVLSRAGIYKVSPSSDTEWFYPFSSRKSGMNGALNSLYGDLVVSTASGQLLLLSNTGVELWSKNLVEGELSELTPPVIDNDNNIIVGDENGVIYAFDRKGDLVWQNSTLSGGSAIRTIAVSKKGYYYIATDSGGRGDSNEIISFSRNKDNEFTLRWSQVLDNPPVSPVAIDYDGNILLVSGASLLAFVDDSGGPSNNWGMAGHDPANTHNICHSNGSLLSLTEDSDKDGLPNCAESFLILNDDENISGLADEDGDGLNNHDEWLIQTEIYLSDTDGDGLSDGDEVNSVDSNPLSFDTDGDGISDKQEIDDGFNPLLPQLKNYQDTDNDGFSNRVEALANTNILDETSYPVNEKLLWTRNLEENAEDRIFSVSDTGTVTVSSNGKLLSFDASGNTVAQSLPAYEDFHVSEIQKIISFNDSLFFIANDYVGVFDKKLNLKWLDVDDKCVNAENFIAKTYDNQLLYVCDEFLTSISSDGEEQWALALHTEKLGQLTLAHTPVIGVDGVINILSDDGVLVRVTNQGEILAEVEVPELVSRYHIDDLAISVDNTLLFLSNGIAKAVTIEGDLLWSKKGFGSQFVILSNGNVASLNATYSRSFNSIKPIALNIYTYRTGEILHSVDLGNHIAPNGNSIAVGSDKNIYILLERVYKVSSEGTLISGESSPPIDNGYSITASRDGMLWLNYDKFLSVQAGTMGNFIPQWSQRKQSQTGTFNLCSNHYVNLSPFADADSDGIKDCLEFYMSRDPEDNSDVANDLDGDGLSDLHELELGTDWTLSDTDFDTLSDGDEVNAHNSNPLSSDTDRDGLNDDFEVYFNLDPNDASDAELDMDNDGFSNRAEFIGSSDPRLSSDLPSLGSSSWSYFHLVIHDNKYSPVITKNGRVVIPTSDNQLSILGRDGNPIWQKAHDAPISNIQVFPDGTVAIIANGFFLYDSDGNVLFELNVDAHNMAIVDDSVILFGGLQSFSGAEDHGFLYSISKEGRINWETEHFVPPHHGDNYQLFVSAIGHIYLCASGNQLVSFNDLGAKRWERLLSGCTGEITFSNQGYIYTALNDQKVIALNPLNGHILWEYKIPSLTANALTTNRMISILVDDNDVLIVSSTKGIYRLNNRGEVLQKLDFSGYEISHSPILDKNGNLIVPSNDGRVFILDKNTLAETDIISNVEITSPISIDNDGIAYFFSSNGVETRLLSNEGIPNVGWPKSLGGIGNMSDHCGIIEKSREDLDKDGLNQCMEALLEFNDNDPSDASDDYDSDTLTNLAELTQYFTDIDNPDSDGDTLSDGDETLLYGTDPWSVDTDGDGFVDKVEISEDNDPVDSNEGFLGISTDGYSNRQSLSFEEDQPLHNGALLWDTPYQGIDDDSFTHLNPRLIAEPVETAVGHNDQLYVIDSNNVLTAFKPNGGFLWSNSLGNKNNHINPYLGIQSSGHLVVITESFDNKLSLNGYSPSGAKTWKHSPPPNMLMQPHLAIDSQDRIYTVVGSSNLLVLDSSGSKLWSLEYADNHSLITNMQLLENQQRLIITTNKGLFVIDIASKTVIASEEARVYKTSAIINAEGQIAVLAENSDDDSYFELIVYDKDLNMDWQFDGPDSSLVNGFFVAKTLTTDFNSRIYVSDQNKLYAIEEGRLIWVANIRIGDIEPIVMDDGSLILFSNNKLNIFSSTGDELWVSQEKFTLPTSGTKPVLVMRDGVIAVADRYRWVAYAGNQKPINIGAYGRFNNRRTNNISELMPFHDELPILEITSLKDGQAIIDSFNVQLEGIASDAQDGDISHAIKWYLGESFIGKGENISAVLPVIGSHVIRAEITDTEGNVGRSRLLIYASSGNTPPIVHFEDAIIYAVDSQQLELSAAVNDENLDNLDLSWNSSLDGELSSALFVLSTSSLSVGRHIITLTATDSFGIEGRDSIVIVVGLDEDTDGIVDELDNCPKTPISALVGMFGCHIGVDDDADGVANSADICVNTPLGALVDVIGCPLDEDGDGVPNGIDQCDKTPAGQTLDAKGCVPSQLDDDKDGVTNDLDLCPATPVGAIINNTGCGLDEDNDGVPDGVDQCANTFSSETVDSIGCALGRARFPSAIGSVNTTDDGFHFEIPSVDGLNPWDIQLVYSLNISVNEEYVACFDAKAANTRTISITVDNGTPPTYDSLIGGAVLRTLSTEFERGIKLPFSVQSLSSDPDRSPRFIFSLAGEAGDVWLENVGVYRGNLCPGEPLISSSSSTSSSPTAGSSSSVAIGSENSLLTSSGAFTSGQEGFAVVGNATFNGEADFTIPSIEGLNPWEIQMMHEFAMVAGEQYVICYDAQAASNRVISVDVDDGSPTFATVMGGAATVALTTDYRRNIEHSFIAPKTQDDVRLVFNLAGDAGDVQLDSIGVYRSEDCPEAASGQSSQATSSEAVDSSLPSASASSSSVSSSSASVASLLNSPGEFTNGREGFAVVGNATFNGEADFTIPSVEGLNPWEIQMMHEFAVVAGEQYIICYDAQAANDRVIAVDVDDGAPTFASLVGGAATVALTTNYLRNIEHSFIAPKTQDDVRLVFNLAGDSGDVQLDNIGVYRSEDCPEAASSSSSRATSSDIFDSSSLPSASASSSSVSSSSASVVSLLNSPGEFANGREGFAVVGNATFNGEADFTIPSVEGLNPWEIQMMHEFAVAAGEQYIICYDAQAANDRVIAVDVDDGAPTFASVIGGAATVALTTDYRRNIEHSFIAPKTQDNVRLVFNLAGDAGDVQLDNIGVYHSENCP